MNSTNERSERGVLKSSIVMTIALALIGVLAAACAGSSDGPAPTRADTTDQGKTIVAERGCASCHQASDDGAGVLSGQTRPRPGTHAYAANLTPDEETGLGSWTDDEIARAIREGKDDQGAALCSTMPRFSDLSDADVAAVVAYLRTLAPVKRQIPESQCGDDAPGPS